MRLKRIQIRKAQTTDAEENISALNNLLENVLEVVPQFTIYGDYGITLALFIGSVGFEISYSMLINELIAPDSIVDCSKFCNLTLHS